MRARCAARRSGQGARRELEHMRLKNLVSLVFSNFIPLISSYSVFASSRHHVRWTFFIRALLSRYQARARNEVIGKENTVIAPVVVVARSRNFAQQIEWYRRRRWRAYCRLARVWVDLLALRSGGRSRRPLADQLCGPGLRLSPSRHTSEFDNDKAGKEKYQSFANESLK